VFRTAGFSLLVKKSKSYFFAQGGAKMTEKKNLSRRDFLKLAGASAMAVTAAGALQGCVVPTVPPTTAPAEAPPPAEEAEGVTLTLAIQAFAHDAMKPVLEEWEGMTGNTVNLESGPTTGQEMMTKYAPGARR
jgi:hypothetical protein